MTGVYSDAVVALQIIEFAVPLKLNIYIYIYIYAERCVERFTVTPRSENVVTTHSVSATHPRRRRPLEWNGVETALSYVRCTLS